ncbi:MAG: tetratricopeptide repeat protein [Bdellovibrionales bacterium]
MSARKAAIKAGLTLTVIVTGTLVFAKETRRSKTVGDILKRIESNTKQVNFKKSQSALPKFKKTEPIKNVNLYQVKPPSRSTLYYEEGTNEAQLERVTDDGIKQLYKLTRQFKTSKRRGELWLRLAELYVEKARLIEYRLQQKYDEQIQKFQRGETKTKPRLNLRAAQDYNKKAIQLYEWFLRDFPKDEKADQALFFLGYNYFELNQPEKGKTFYQRLTKEHPSSTYIEESNFALGEYYFDREIWADALKHYELVARNRRARLYAFALYKMAWCQYKTGAIRQGLSSLEKVIRAGRVAKGNQDASSGGVSRIRLATEAQKDLVVFFAEAGTARNARAYFEEVAGEKQAFGLMERLAYYYSDTGNREGARSIFRELIAERPTAPKAYDYQYQIVTLYVSTERGDIFNNELVNWIQNYSPDSDWARANRKDKELVARAAQLIETTLRNHILQQHQTAQTSRVRGAQESAKKGYQLYFQSIKDGPKLDEMRFFYGELLFDMKDYENAAQQYAWVVEKAPNSPYFERAALNQVLAAEKGLPKEEDLKKMVGESLDPVPFSANVKAFETAALKYSGAFPKGENVPAMKYKLGALYYYHNQFGKALESFNSIIKEYPKSQYAQYAANLTLDIFNLKKDYGGLEEAGKAILANEDLANSQVGDQVKGVLQRASFKKAQDLESKKDYMGAAQAYEEFVKKNPNSDLGISASFNSAVNYERGGDLAKAISMYGVVLNDKDPKNENLRKSSSQFIAALYERTGQYERAAKAFEAYAAKHPKEKESITFYYNAAVIRDGMNSYSRALQNYQTYFDKKRGSEKFEAVFLMAKLQQRRGNITLAKSYYKQYYDARPKNGAALVEAALQIAQIHARKGQRKDAEDWYKKTIGQQKYQSQTKPVGVRFAAEAKYILVSKIYDELKAIRIPANPARQQEAIKQKLALLERLKNQLKDVIRYDDAHFIVNSLALIGQAYQHMAAAIYAVPLPKGLDEEGLKQYKAGVDGIAKPFQDDAVKSYEQAMQKGFELEGYSDGLKTAVTELSRLQPEKYPSHGEKAIITKLPDKMGIEEDKDLGGAYRAKDEGILVEAVSKRLGKDEKDVRALSALALFYFEQGKLGLAKIILGRAIKAHPKDPGVLNNLGVVYLAEGDQRSAIASFRQALEAKSSYDVAAANLGSIFVEYRDYSRAVDLLEDGYSFVKSDLKRGVGLDVANNYALALSATGKHDNAKDIFKDILKADAGNTTALLNYSILLIHHLKDKKEGEKMLNKLKFLSEGNEMKNAIEDLDKQLSQ